MWELNQIYISQVYRIHVPMISKAVKFLPRFYAVQIAATPNNGHNPFLHLGAAPGEEIVCGFGCYI